MLYRIIEIYKREPALIYIMIVAEIITETKKRILKEYRKEKHQKEIKISVKKSKDTLITLIKYRFYLGDNGLIYYRDINKRYQLCLLESLELEIFKIAYNKYLYLQFNKTYLRISETLYFYKLYKYLLEFINSYHYYS